MPLSDVDRQLMLIQSVGDVDPLTGDPVTPTAQGVTGIVFSNIGRLWLKYADKAVVNSEIRDLYVLRDSHDLVIACLERLVDFATNNGQISIHLARRAQVHQQQRQALTADILRMEKLSSAQSGFQVGTIAATEIISPPLPGERSSSWPFGPNGNDPRYAGSPYWRPSRGRP